MRNISDKKLITIFLNGNDKAFEVLLSRHLKPIYNFLYRLTGDRSSVEDLAQEVFIKVWKNLSHFDRTKNFRVWIFTIAKNTAYDFLKKKKSIPFSFFEDKEGNSQFDNIVDDKLDPNAILENADLRKDLEKKLQKIPKNYRLILLLRYKDDFSLSEIADILKIPYNTVKSQHQRALQHLRKIFSRPN